LEEAFKVVVELSNAERPNHPPQADTSAASGKIYQSAFLTFTGVAGIMPKFISEKDVETVYRE
jgi:hypothetical protein